MGKRQRAAPPRKGTTETLTQEEITATSKERHGDDDQEEKAHWRDRNEEDEGCGHKAWTRVRGTWNVDVGRGRGVWTRVRTTRSMDADRGCGAWTKSMDMECGTRTPHRQASEEGSSPGGTLTPGLTGSRAHPHPHPSTTVLLLLNAPGKGLITTRQTSQTSGDRKKPQKVCSI